MANEKAKSCLQFTCRGVNMTTPPVTVRIRSRDGKLIEKTVKGEQAGLLRKLAEMPVPVLINSVHVMWNANHCSRS